MNAKHLLLGGLLSLLFSCSPSESWAPLTDHILTRWASDVNPSAPLPEYPRPQMVRPDWKSLNGLWDYAVAEASAASFPEQADGRILVPYPLESALSGVGKHITAEESLWYRTSFKVPSSWKGKSVLLNFGAVDWQAEVWVNGSFAGAHTGGYTAFSLDITPYLKKGRQTLEVKVLDATDNDFQPRGKQLTDFHGIWYTPVSGIWQSVWMEPVSEARIIGYNCVSDIYAGTLLVTPEAFGTAPGDILEVSVLSPEGEVLSVAEAAPGEPAQLQVDGPSLWSPETPVLYGLSLRLLRDGKETDRVSGYTAFREVKEIRDAQGHRRLSLNGKPCFQFGPLDQGWWPDGLYTAPTDEALRFDIEKTKEMGFNLIRKHVKVEPARWYYWADVLGMLVWQDMPNVSNHHSGYWEQFKWAVPAYDNKLGDASNANYYKEWGEIISQRKVFPCIVVWVPFNEAWGQFDTDKVVAFTKRQDPTRLVNAASGGNSFPGVGDIFDSHNYPDPHMKFWSGGTQIDVLGEYGGIGWAVEGHLWTPDRNWGYVRFQSGEEVLAQYREYALQLKETVREGCAAAIYTQTTDVEIEVNGLMTYDRAVVKMPEQELREINTDVINSL